MKKLLALTLVCAAALSSCKKEGCTDPNATNYNENATQDDGSCETTVDNSGPKLIVKLHFDPNQPRLDNFGNPASLPATHSAQSPTFHAMSAHYIELAQTQYTQLGDGEIIYMGAETTAGGSNAVNFDQAIVKGDNQTFVEIPLSSISPDTYNWLRVSLTYQNFDIDYRVSGMDLTGRLASFVGYNTYITNYVIQNESVTLNQNKLQGYWGFETLGLVYEGQATATTVPNPLSATSPVPAGSCVVTGDFDIPFTLTGNETDDIILTLNLSTNQSFEWYDDNQNGIYEPNDGDYPVDMGLRGLEPVIQ
jgi:hypothetical protein